MLALLSNPNLPLGCVEAATANAADTLDLNGNNIPGYADGISNIATGAADSLPQGTFAPLQLSVLGITNPANADIEFLYSAADPNSTTQTADSTGKLDTYSPGSGGYMYGRVPGNYCQAAASPPPFYYLGSSAMAAGS